VRGRNDRAQRDELRRAHGIRQAPDRNVAERGGFGECRARSLHVVGDHGFARRCEVGEPCREVHRVSGDRVVAMRSAARRSGNDLAARDADMGAEFAPAVSREARHCVVNCNGRTQRPLDVVAVRDRRAEHAHDGIADVFVDRAAGALDHAVDEFEEARQKRMRFLGVLCPRQACVARQIREQDRHLAPLARRHRRAVAAGQVVQHGHAVSGVQQGRHGH